MSFSDCVVCGCMPVIRGLCCSCDEERSPNVLLAMRAYEAGAADENGVLRARVARLEALLRTSANRLRKMQVGLYVVWDIDAALAEAKP